MTHRRWYIDYNVDARRVPCDARGPDYLNASTFRLIGTPKRVKVE